MDFELNETLARKVLTTVDAGLVNGIGSPAPGKMCVEAAVCYAMGLPHSDRPTCVGDAVRRFKIRLNDSRWSSNETRTAGMRKLAIAQLGSNEIDQKAFAKIIVEQTIRQILPITLRAAASRNPKHAAVLEGAAIGCEQEGTGAATKNAKEVAKVVRADAAAAAAAVAYADAVAYAARDSMLNKMAEIGLAALIELNSPGCAYLYLTEIACAQITNPNPSRCATPTKKARTCSPCLRSSC